MQERRLAVLRAIVEDYVTTREPVGSKALVERHQLGVSSATVRNDMAALEEEGLIAHPHTSAGRIPTDKGYRFFVDRLAQIKPMSSAERRAIESFLEGAYDLDDVISRSVRLLAQLTQQVAIIQYPTMSTSTIRHIEVVALSSSRVLLVLILSTGRVEQLVVEVPVEVDDELVGTLRLRVNEAVATKPITEAVRSLETLSERTASVIGLVATASL
ncbi:MAG TPA: heat-inducible transcriptional repressor HrcA, partial [Marmoricola sp.]|nr:heat-inducible transcriptional repressor HrcA [Marmoricola sp.]